MLAVKIIGGIFCVCLALICILIIVGTIIYGDNNKDINNTRNGGK